MRRHGRGAARPSTTSTAPPGASAGANPSMSSVTVAEIQASWSRTAFGVNRRETSDRCSWWRGSSWAIMLVSSGEWNER